MKVLIEVSFEPAHGRTQWVAYRRWRELGDPDGALVQEVFRLLNEDDHGRPLPPSARPLGYVVSPPPEAGR